MCEHTELTNLTGLTTQYLGLPLIMQVSLQQIWMEMRVHECALFLSRAGYSPERVITILLKPQLPIVNPVNESDALTRCQDTRF